MPADAANPAPAPRRWSQAVSRRSNALDLEPGVFTWRDPRRIAASLRRSAETSTRRKANPYASAMAMLCFYLNRAGRRLDPQQRQVLERAKQELRRQFRRGAAGSDAGAIHPARPGAGASGPQAPG